MVFIFIYFMNEQEIQLDIQNKQKQLEDLKAKILAEQKAEEKNKLEEEKKKLEEEIASKNDDLDKLKGTIDTVSADTEATYRLIVGTEMEKKMKDAGKTDIEIKEFAEKIDAVVRKFLDKELEGFSNKIKNPMCTGIQFAMMETLTAQWASSADFFTTFSETDVSSWVNALEWMLKSFTTGAGNLLGSFDKWNKFFELARRVQNITQFVKFKKEAITTQESIPELMNSYKFKQLLNNPIRNDYQNIYKESTMDLLHLGSADGITLSPEEETALKTIANDPNMKIDEATLTSIEKALGTADKFLDMRDTYQDSATGIFSKLQTVLDINIPILGSLWSLVGLEWPADLLGDSTKPHPVVDFVLNILWISGGIKWLHTKYVMENYDKLMTSDQKAVVGAAFKNYQSKATTDDIKTNDDSNSTWKLFEAQFAGMSDEQTALLKQKLPPQYSLLKESVVSLLDDPKTVLSPALIQKFAPELIVDGKVNLTSVTDKPAFADKYLQFMIPYLVSLGDKFIASPQVTWPDVVAFTILGAGTGDKFLIEAMHLWAISLRDFGSPSTTPEQSPEANQEAITGTEKLSSLTFAQAKNFAYAIFGHGPATELLIKLSKDNPAMILRTIALAKHEWWLKFGRRNDDPNKASGQKNIWTFQISDKADVQKKYDAALAVGKTLWWWEDLDTTATNLTAQQDLWSWLGYVSSGRWGQATFDKLADATLSDLAVKSLMSDTIQWGIEAIGQWVVTQIATETTQTYLNLSDFRTVAEKTVVTPEKVADTTVIAAKSMNQVAGFWDSSMEWLKLSWLSNSVFFRWLSTEELYQKLKSEATTANREMIKKYLSCVITTGYNDITKNKLSTTAASLEKIISAIKPTQAILCTMVYAKDKTTIPDAKIDELNKIIREVATKTKSPLIDLYEKTKTTSLTYWDDGMHLTAASYKLLADNIKETIEPKA